MSTIHQDRKDGVYVVRTGATEACYENPLFEEDGTAITDTQTKLHRQTDGLRTKPYALPNAAQTSVHYRQNKPRKRKGLYVLGLLVTVIAIVAIVTAVMIGQRADSSTEQPRDRVLLYRTKVIAGRLRIIQGPFSSFKQEYSDKSSTSFELFSSLFTYQMNNIFIRSDVGTSFSHTDIVNISSGSVLVVFILHFTEPIDIYPTSSTDLANYIIDGFNIGVLLIDRQSVNIQPEDPALSVITTSTPGVCIPMTSSNCVNFSNWATTTFPNILGHHSPAEVATAEAAHKDLFYTSCGRDFWCAVFNPKCKNSNALPPCRSYCKVVFSSCEGMYESNIDDLLNCDDLPDSEDSNICAQDPFKPGKCLQNNEDRCQNIGYNQITFPNYAGQRSPYHATELIQLIEGINMATKCYKHSLLFACTALMPKCTGTGLVPGHAVPPCKSLCNAFKSRCSIFMDIFWHPWPEHLYCDSFPDQNDTSVCLGYMEAHESPTLEDCPAGEERCDNTTCIPLSWRCDGYMDCSDGSDETAIQTTLPLRKCVDCSAGMFRCSFESAVCIEADLRCDGIEDCPTASDERECVKLDDGGRHGVLAVYNPGTDSWISVCSDGWGTAQSDIVCLQMGYTESSSTSPIATASSSLYFVLTSLRNGSSSIYIGSQLRQTDTCTSGTVVAISCSVPVCGVRPAFIQQSTRVVGGKIADPNAWPWHVSVFGGADQKYFCGGTIIDEKWLLTAGHCIGGHRTPNDLTFRAGQPRRDTYSQYVQEFHAAELFLHPEYNVHTVDNDIALIRLKETIRFNDHVRPACLPASEKRLPVGTRCTVIGWGKQGDTAVDYERQILQVNLEVTDWGKCKYAIENADIQVPYQLTDHMFCAGGGLDHDSCSGDSGGPYLCRVENTPDTWYVAGIVSWGVACAYPNVPGVYTNVPGFLGWIRNITGLDYL